MLVLRERRGQTVVLTLNRPDAANSLNPPLLQELGLALQEILDDVEVRAVVVTGAGDRVFCAGMDLSELGGWDDQGSPATEQPGARALSDFMGGTYAKPLIAAVNGAAVGGGFELVMACDLVVASDHARFGLPEVRRGLFPAGGGTVLATRIPQALALELGLTGRLIAAARAEQWGLVNQVVPATDLVAAATALAAEVAANGPLAVQLTKRLMRAAVTDGAEAGLATTDESSSIFRSEDAREGAEAFMAKRAPVFVGR